MANGVLVATVANIVENNDIKTAMLNVSFACHMPDCLEMPYKPRIRGAYTILLRANPPIGWEEIAVERRFHGVIGRSINLWKLASHCL